jgi:hypothetical protein
VRSATEVPNYVVGRPCYSHGKISFDRFGVWRYDRNLVPVLVLGPCHLEHGQNRGRQDEEFRVDKVPPGAYSSTCTKRQRECGIITEGTILVEETIGLECLWLRI